MKTTLLAILLPFTVFAADYAVDPSSTPQSNCYQTIQAALDAAATNGDEPILLLKPGSYASSGPLVLRAGTVIKGSHETLLLMDIRLDGEAMLEGLQVLGTAETTSPDNCLVVRDVKFTQGISGIKLVGTYYTPEGFNVAGLPPGTPLGDEAASWAAVTNHVAQALAQSGKYGKASAGGVVGGIYDYVDVISNFLYNAMLAGDATVSNFAITYTDAATNALAQTIGSGITYSRTVIVTSDTLVVEAACIAPAPVGGARKGARMLGTSYAVLGQHVTASRNGEIAFIDLHKDAVGNCPSTIVVTGDGGLNPVTSILRQEVQDGDTTWYRYSFAPHVGITEGDVYEIRFEGGATLNLDCIDNGFAAGHAILADGTIPTYNLQFRTLIYEYVPETDPAVQITSGGIAVQGNATITLDGEAVTTRNYVDQTILAFEQELMADYVQKNGGEQTMQGPLKITQPITDPQHAVTKEHLDAHFVPRQPQEVTHAPASSSQHVINGSYPWDCPPNWFRSENDGYLSAYAGALPGDAFTKTVRLIGWGYSIPSGATIVGLKARVVQRGLYKGKMFFQLSNIGSAIGSRKIDSTQANVVLGGQSDLWGASLTPQIVNSPEFGLDFCCMNEAYYNYVIHYVDYIEMTVYYYLAGAPVTILAESITLTGTSSDPNSVATRNYVETQVNQKVNTLGQTLSEQYVEKTGEQTMQGPLKITTSPAAAQDALTMGHADGRYINVLGDTMAGSLDMNGHTIVNLPSPILSHEPATKAYVDSRSTSVTRPPGTVFQNVGWTNPNGCLVAGDGITAAYAGSGQAALVISGWNFGVPDGSKIEGISVRVVHPDSTARITTLYMRWNPLFYSGNRYIDNPSGRGESVVGDSHDTWGCNLTADDINDPELTVVFLVSAPAVEVDYVEMTVYYKESAFIGDGTVTESKIANEAVTADKIADGAVTADKLGDDVDNRFVCKDSTDEQVMVGPLTIQDKLVAHGPWEIWGVPIILMPSDDETDVKITTDGDLDLVLDADVGRSVVVNKPLRANLGITAAGTTVNVHKPLALPGNNAQIGVATAVANNTEPTTVPCPACTQESMVIITPREDIGAGNYYWVVPGDGEFNLHQSKSEEWPFAFLVVPQSN